MFLYLRIWQPAFWLATFAALPSLEAAENENQALHVTLESRLLADVADGLLDDFSLCEAALIAAGCNSPNRLERSLRRFAQLGEIARTQISTSDSPREQAASLFACLHRESLTGVYRAADWDVGITLDEGHYNCLMATILYLELCRRFDLPVLAISAPGHVFCRLETEPFDVETTHPRWFKLTDAAREKHRRTVATCPLGDVELLAKVYYNRGLALLAENRYREAVQSLATSRRLDPPDVAARENEVAALNNWALALVAQGRFEEASRRIEEGLALDPLSKLLQANAQHVKAAQNRALSE